MTIQASRGKFTSKAPNPINAPQAQDDWAIVSADSFVFVDVLANDRGGNSISLYSVNQADLRTPPPRRG